MKKNKEMEYPKIKIHETDGNTYVYWEEKMIVEIKENRFLRFRATYHNERWIGVEKKGNK